MVVADQTDTMYADNYHTLEWQALLDGGGAVLDLTGRIVKFALARFNSAGVPLRENPVLDFASDDVSPQVTVPNPNPDIDTGPFPHVIVELLPVDTATLAPVKDVAFYFELEVFEGDGSRPVVVATGTLTVKLNVENA
jgi:hypothetical protein